MKKYIFTLIGAALSVCFSTFAATQTYFHAPATEQQNKLDPYICCMVALNHATPTPQKLQAAKDLVNLGLLDLAADIYILIGKNSQNSPDEKLAAAWALEQLNQRDEAAKISASILGTSEGANSGESRAAYIEDSDRSPVKIGCTPGVYNWFKQLARQLRTKQPNKRRNHFL